MYNDLISRSALLEEIGERILEEDEIEDKLDVQYNIGLLKAIKDVKRAPAVDAEPVRQAKWVWDNDAIDWGLGAWVCSKCGGRNDNIHAGKPGTDGGFGANPYIWSGSNYCPNCGAKMGKKE